MKVQALINYKDKELNRDVNKGEILEVTKERAEVLLKGNNSSGNKPFVKVIEEEKPKAKKKVKVEETEVKEE